MKTYTVCKADPITEPVEGVNLVISDDLPYFHTLKTLEHAEIFYKVQAGIVFNALNESLPQGTRHQLLIIMLEKHVNLYRGR